MLIASPAFGQGIGESTGVNQMLDRAPTGQDLLLEVHQFDLFQQAITDSSDKRGDDAVRKFASAQSDATDKRDKQVTSLARKAGFHIEFTDEPSVTRNDLLSGLDGAVGQAYVKEFYSAEILQHQTAISVLKRYTANPDNDEILAFAKDQLPALEATLKKAQEASPG
jgi:predicted outer membrane protein